MLGILTVSHHRCSDTMRYRHLELPTNPPQVSHMRSLSNSEAEAPKILAADDMECC